MSKRLWLCGGASLLWLWPQAAWAAGKKATELVVVADTRKLSGINKYFATLYNENIWLFALWAVVLTALLGCVLGVIMDFIMKRTGIDLTSREIIEH